MSEYAHPEVLVTTAWVEKNKDQQQVIVVEVDVDTSAYETGHIPGAIAWNWQTQLADTVQRDILSRAALQDLMRQSGIRNSDIVVLYGDNNNWFAAWAFWQLKIYGHADVRIMDGGRKKWLAEDRATSTAAKRPVESDYTAGDADNSLRAFLTDVQVAVRENGTAMVDVRSADEFTGKILAPPGLPETCQRGGHIPGASNITWALACNDDGTFKSAADLRELYAQHGVTSDKDVITYCRIGERSSHSWFVLKYLLGFNNVRNYDGSWTEWGNLVGAPVAVGAE